MSSLLLHQSCAITEWGFHSGMQFAHNDNDEFLLELFLSTMQQRRRLWTAVPSYIKTIRAAHEHHTTMVIDQDRLGLSSWSMENIRTQNTEISDSQWMHALHIRFWKNDMFLFKVSVTYIMEYAAMEGFYYIGVLGWYTRTRTIQECFTRYLGNGQTGPRFPLDPSGFRLRTNAYRPLSKDPYPSNPSHPTPTAAP
jgi:hypothetical protein